MGGMHHFLRKRRGRVANEGDVIADLHCVARGRFNASIGKKPDDDHVADAMLLQLLIEVGVGKAALSPMFLNNDVAGRGRKVRIPVAAPLPSGERMTIHDRDLRRIGIIPVLIVPGLPAPVRDEDGLDPRFPCGGPDRLHVCDQVDLGGDGLDAWPDLAALGQKIIVGIDDEERR